MRKYERWNIICRFGMGGRRMKMNGGEVNENIGCMTKKEILGYMGMRKREGENWA